jgi:3-hydroxyisobutyrate dehydrogenase-like beta-hydroxyacid dehydrogenase
MPLKVGFVGLGEMGKWMALNLIKKGFQLTVFDINPAPVSELKQNGAVAANSANEVARNSDLVLLSLPDTEIVQAVIYGENGLTAGLVKGTTLVDLSTIDYQTSVKIAKDLKGKGITFVDAPVSGQEARAKKGTLTVMIGATETKMESYKAVFGAIANNIFYTGKNGSGQLSKMVNQLFYNVSVAAMAELLPMAVKMGLDAENIVKIVSTGTGQTFALDFYGPYVLDNNFVPGYPMGKAYKDMVIAMELSSHEKIPLPVTTAAMQTYQMALIEGYGKENKGAMIKVWENKLGVKVRRKGV